MGLKSLEEAPLWNSNYVRHFLAGLLLNMSGSHRRKMHVGLLSEAFVGDMMCFGPAFVPTDANDSFVKVPHHSVMRVSCRMEEVQTPA